jgi:hypothetical protein
VSLTFFVSSALQVHSGQLQAVLDIVVSHQGAPLKCALLQRLMSALVLPAPEHYRSLLRRLAALSGEERGSRVWCCWGRAAWLCSLPATPSLLSLPSLPSLLSLLARNGDQPGRQTLGSPSRSAGSKLAWLAARRGTHRRASPCPRPCPRARRC